MSRHTSVCPVINVIISKLHVVIPVVSQTTSWHNYAERTLLSALRIQTSIPEGPEGKIAA
jgi:hypothetical protein